MSLRIAMLLDAWDYPTNGLVVSTRRFVRALLERGHQVTVITAGQPQDCDSQRLETGLRVVRFPELRIPFANDLIHDMGFPLARPQRNRLRTALADCQLLHLQAPFLLADRAIPVADEMGLPVVGSFHVQPENMLRSVHLNYRFMVRLLYRLFIRRIYDRCDQVLCPSKLAMQLLEENGLKAPAEVLSNGVPGHFFELPREQLPEPDEFVILGVGRMAEEKCQDLIIEAIRKSRNRQRIRLVLVGRGPLLAHYRHLARDLPLSPRIGPVDDTTLQRWYRRADLFVHAGEIELEGMSTLEAIASGCAAVISDAATSATRQFAVDQRALFPFPDTDALAERIDYWAEHPAERNAAGAANRDLARRFSHRESVDRLERIYKDVLARHVSSSRDDRDARSVA